jgi:hypothetical protein
VLKAIGALEPENVWARTTRTQRSIP